MNWYYKVLGDHTHVRVFMGGAKRGDLCFRNKEFKFLLEAEEVREIRNGKLIVFIDETPPTHVKDCELGENWKECPACRASRSA